MAATELNYQSLIARVVEILKADTTNIFGQTKIRTIINGLPGRGKYPYPYAYVALQRVNDTFYDTGILTSNYEISLQIGVFSAKKDGAELEKELLGFAHYIKLAIKNNTHLYKPGTTLDGQVARAWPLRLEKAQGYVNDNVVGGIWITVRATANS
jgi:hypothetical protein